MGTYRFILSALVVLYHFGGFPPLAGMSAVFGFYLLSGYLMALVVDKVYSTTELGTVSFYLNRALRIFPLYIVYVILSLFVVHLHGGSGFYVDLDKPNNLSYLFPDYVISYRVPQIMHELVLSFFKIDMIKITAAYLLNGFPSMVPQAWSLAVELIFYLTVPFIVGVYKYRIGRVFACSLLLLSIGFNIVTSINGLDFPTYRYRSVFGVFYIFMLGVILYFHKSWIPVFKYSRQTGLIAVVAYLLLVVLSGAALKESEMYIALFIQFVATAFLIIKPTSENSIFRRADAFFGKLSYGMFVGHFFAGMLLFLVTEMCVISKWMYIVGKPGTTMFGLSCIGLTVSLTLVLYRVVEKPIDSLRDIVRHRTPKVQSSSLKKAV